MTPLVAGIYTAALQQQGGRGKGGGGFLGGQGGRGGKELKKIAN